MGRVSHCLSPPGQDSRSRWPLPWLYCRVVPLEFVTKWSLSLTTEPLFVDSRVGMVTSLVPVGCVVMLRIGFRIGESSGGSSFGYSNLQQSIHTCLSDLHQVFNPSVVFSGRVTDEINHLRSHHARRDELDQTLASLDQANMLLANVRHDLEVGKGKSGDDLAALQRKLNEANDRLSNSKFLAAEFKKTQDYVDLQNAAMECGVS
ncbi:uncharacterized protein LOC111016203 [Momordica charantia]|uniref:Uncharacterized protein LOC111016203 n=1 Tax=Momordica charantia TaxID=3673 RepID=A0A6J1D0L6_MOMCH|nr:uncharacterized protein LOC111016203 [Momordica charantia]